MEIKNFNNILFVEDDLTNNTVKKLIKSNNKQDKEFANLILNLESRNDLFKDKDVVHIPTKTKFVERKEKQLIYFLLLWWIFSGFTCRCRYTYQMSSRRLIAKKKKNEEIL